jgi:hypothetical protein
LTGFATHDRTDLKDAWFGPYKNSLGSFFFQTTGPFFSYFDQLYLKQKRDKIVHFQSPGSNYQIPNINSYTISIGYLIYCKARNCDTYGSWNKKQETRNEKQETRNEKQETRNKKQEMSLFTLLEV